MITTKRQGWWIFLLLLSGPAGFAQIRVPKLVSDGMVLQRETPLRIWGFGSPGEKVTVKFAGESGSGTTGDDGKWIVELGPRKAGGPFTMDIDGINHIWIKNIMVGEVWFCAGDRHMQLPMEQLKEQYADQIAHAADVPVREFSIAEHYDYKGPRTNVSSGHWETANENTVLSFPALSYLFARQVYDHYHCTVGLISACVGDAPAEAWLSPGALRQFPDYASAATRYADSVFPEGTGPADRMATGGLFNGMIAPSDTYTIRGFLWYQGETNIPKPGDYTAVFPVLIEDWRRHWAQGETPFLYVQLQAHGAVQAEPGESPWAELREAQLEALRLPGTGMTVSADLDADGNLQPKDYDEIARRLMVSAEGIAYGKKDIIYSGPLFSSMKAHGDRVHILFTETNTGLIAKGGGELKGFAIAGPDNKFYPAKAETDGKKIIVWSDQVKQPEAVRYGWADNPFGMNLFNRDLLFKDGLPAPPFAGRVKAKRSQVPAGN